MLNTKNNKGMAMVSVMIVVTLMAILAGTCIQLSYLTYTRKVVERRSNETFYTAESCVDTMKTAVQNKVAAQLLLAKEGKDKFIDAAYNSLSSIDLEKYLKDQIMYKNGIESDDKSNWRTDFGIFKGYKSKDESTYIKDGITSIDDGGLGGEFSIGIIEKDSVNKKLVIRDVHIVFVNKMGYVGEVSTDIVVNAPVYASDISVPVASYSMFAGAGASVSSVGQYQNNGAHEAVYIHQEGNVYFGNGTYNTHARAAALYLEPNDNSRGGVYFSIGGNNAVFNGDVCLDDGSTLIFTGGDGRTDAYVQVNGYIYMRDGATLLLANNVHLSCKGIKVDEDGDDLSFNTTNDYTGLFAASESVSQFYPVSSSYASTCANANAEYNKYINYSTGAATTADVPSVLSKLNDGKLPGGFDKLDSRAEQVAKDLSKQHCAVYVLKADRDSILGWKHQSSDAYHLVTKNGSTYEITGSSGVYNNNIYTNALDVKLQTEPWVKYNGTNIDPEYARIVNMPLMHMYNYTTNKYMGSNTTIYTGYNTADPNSFTTVKYSELEDALVADNLSSVKDAINWTDIDAGMVDVNKRLNINLKDRKFRIPVNTTVDNSLSKDNLSVTLADGTVYKSGILAVGITDGDHCVVNTDDTAYYIAVNECPIELHMGQKPYSGMFVSATNVSMGYNAGVTRGVSLLELANRTANPGLSKDNVDNPVRKVLETISGSAMINPQNNKYGTDLNSKATFLGAIIFDNLFNGGIESFWMDNKKDISNPDANDNSDMDFVEVDNWQKDN